MHMGIKPYRSIIGARKSKMNTMSSPVIMTNDVCNDVEMMDILGMMPTLQIIVDPGNLYSRI